MKTIHAILIMAAILSGLGTFGIQQAMGGTTPTTGSVSVNSACELTTASTLNYAAGNPLTDSSSGSSPGVGEAIKNLSNANGNLNSVVQVSGTDWVNGTGFIIQAPSSTKYSTTSGTFASKTNLNPSLASLVTISAGANVNTFWDVAIDLTSKPSHTGVMTQPMTFDFTCA